MKGNSLTSKGLTPRRLIAIACAVHHWESITYQRVWATPSLCEPLVALMKAMKDHSLCITADQFSLCVRFVVFCGIGVSTGQGGGKERSEGGRGGELASVLL